MTPITRLAKACISEHATRQLIGKIPPDARPQFLVGMIISTASAVQTAKGADLVSLIWESIALANAMLEEYGHPVDGETES